MAGTAFFDHYASADGRDFFSAFESSNNVVNCRGDGARGQTAAQGGTGYLYLTAGASHTCGLDAAGEATCWGGKTPPLASIISSS